MDHIPKISIVVPIYNAEPYLRQCLDSIVAQSLKDIEIILVNDGSKDGSEAICKEYLSDTRVKYISKDNAGCVMARKDGIMLARGEYVGFVDSDDWIDASMYETMYKAAQKDNADIVFCNCVLNENDYFFTPEMESGLYNLEDIKDRILPKTLAYIGKHGEKRAIRWSNCLRIFKRELLQGIRFNPKIRRCEDLVLTYEATLKAKSFVYLGNAYLYHNRVVLLSKSRRYTKNAWEAFSALIKHLYEDTEILNDEKLIQQMHLRAFFSVTDCLENELKFINQTRLLGVRQISAIMDDAICDRFKDKIPVEQLCRRYRKFYNYIQKKQCLLLILYDKISYYEEQMCKKIYSPLCNFITEGPIIGSIYKRVRRFYKN